MQRLARMRCRGGAFDHVVLLMRARRSGSLAVRVGANRWIRYERGELDAPSRQVERSAALSVALASLTDEL